MLNFYNTLSRKKEPFKPFDKNEVGLYSCGPTVYNYAHIGNLRTYIFVDVLKRVLKYDNYNVKHVMNITDVGHLTDDADQGEDKLEKGSKREGKSAFELAEFYTKAFKEDLDRLNIIEPNIWCKATDYIDEQIDFIKTLEKKGFTYVIEDGVYFDSLKYSDYAKLARLNIEGQEEGARVEKVKGKKNSTDFALWKFSRKDENRQMEWPSPWGVGFPGWHLECSAMSMKHLGEEFDIHCGGIDHIPVHHTNERAQNWGATGKETVRTWMHGEFLIINKEKMAKSGENFITTQSIIDHGISPLAYRYLCLQTHYRSQMNFSWESLQAANNGLDGLRSKVCGLKLDLNHESIIPPSLKLRRTSMNQVAEKYSEKFNIAINDDLDMPKAVAIVYEVIKDKELSENNKLDLILKFDEVLGLGLSDVKTIEIPEEITKLAQERQKARIDKDWSKADELRVEIEKKGFEVEDGENEYKIIKK